jgi:hypothetical protein
MGVHWHMHGGGVGNNSDCGVGNNSDCDRQETVDGVGNNSDCDRQETVEEVGKNLDCDKSDGLLKGLEQPGPDRPKLCSRV